MKKTIKIIILSAIILLSAVNPKTAYASDDVSKDTRPDYIIRVNRALDCVTVYRIDEGRGQMPIKAMVCSTAKEGRITPLGTFYTSDYYGDWHKMVGNVYAQYSVRFNNSILFHSVPYFKPSPDSLEWEEYNKLGEHASLGCVRLAVSDCKWIYDNCKQGTQVIVYDNPDNPGPLGKPTPIVINPEEEELRNWDPTDPNSNNPWREFI